MYSAGGFSFVALFFGNLQYSTSLMMLFCPCSPEGAVRQSNGDWRLGQWYGCVSIYWLLQGQSMGNRSITSAMETNVQLMEIQIKLVDALTQLQVQHT